MMVMSLMHTVQASAELPCLRIHDVHPQDRPHALASRQKCRRRRYGGACMHAYACAGAGAEVGGHRKAAAQAMVSRGSRQASRQPYSSSLPVLGARGRAARCRPSTVRRWLPLSSAPMLSSRATAPATATSGGGSGARARKAPMLPPVSKPLPSSSFTCGHDALLAEASTIPRSGCLDCQFLTAAQQVNQPGSKPQQTPSDPSTAAGAGVQQGHYDSYWGSDSSSAMACAASDIRACWDSRALTFTA